MTCGGLGVGGVSMRDVSGMGWDGMEWRPVALALSFSFSLSFGNVLLGCTSVYL